MIKNLSRSLKKHFNLHFSRAKCLEEMISGLIKAGSVQLFRIGEEFSNVTSLVETHRRRIQNFIKADNILHDEDLASYILALLNQGQKLILAIDRTNWKFGETIHNLFVLAVVIDNNAVPLFILPLDHMGNSDTQQRIMLISSFINLFGVDCIDCITGDREFVGDDWIEWLCEHDVPFVMRCRENIGFKHPNGGKMLVSKWFSPTNEEEVQVKTSIGKHPIHLTGKAIKHKPDKIKKTSKKRKKSLKESNKTDKKKEKSHELLVVMSSVSIKNPLQTYKKRWGIECLFKGLKSHGFDLELSHIKNQASFLTLVKVVCLAFAISFSAGLALQHEKPIPFRKTVNSKLLSVFRYGMDFLKRNFKNHQRKITCVFYGFKGVHKILGIFVT